MTTALDDIFYIFIEEQNEKSIIKLVQDFNWKIMPFAGNYPDDLEPYSNQYDIDDIMDDLRSRYDYVEEISYNDIDDYMS
jgi:hypothetical protein